MALSAGSFVQFSFSSKFIIASFHMHNTIKTSFRIKTIICICFKSTILYLTLTYIYHKVTSSLMISLSNSSATNWKTDDIGSYTILFSLFHDALHRRILHMSQISLEFNCIFIFEI